MTLGFIILGLLSKEPMTGYDLKNFFDQAINFFWSAELSQIYRELGKLENLGYIRSEIIQQDNRPNKKIYHVTNNGEKAFIIWLNDFPQELTSTDRNEFLVRIFFSSKLSFKDFTRHLENYISQQEKDLRTFKIIEERLNKKQVDNSNCLDYLFQKLTVRRGVLFTEAAIVWAKECLEAIH